MRIISFLIFVFFYQNTFACSVRLRDVDERYHLSKDIYVGYVVGAHFNSFEEQIIKDEIFFERKAWRIPSKITYRIRVKETLKGEEKEEIIFTHSNCGNGWAKLKQRVIIHRYETHDFALPLDKDLYDQVTANKTRNEMDGSVEPPIR